MNWDSEVPPHPVAEVYDAIDEHEPEGLTGEAVDQLAAAKDGAKATIAELGIDDGVLVGVEFAGSTGPDPLPIVTTRIRQVAPPPEPEAAEAEVKEEEPAPA
jgi:hypothetical protein